MPLKCGFCKACSQTSRLLALFHSQMVTGLLVPQTPILLVCSSPPGAWRMLDGYFLLFSVKPNIIRHQSTIQINPMPPIMPIGRQHDFLRILGRSIAGVRTLKTPCVWVRASGMFRVRVRASFLAPPGCATEPSFHMQIPHTGRMDISSSHWLCSMGEKSGSTTGSRATCRPSQAEQNDD